MSGPVELEQCARNGTESGQSGEELRFCYITGCRDPADGQKLVDQIRKTEGITTGSVDLVPLDLTRLASVREFAAAVLAKGLKIHLLINNAGVMGIPFKLTPDGHETQFQVNYLSHFLLTNLLLPRMLESAASNQIGRAHV